MAVTVMKQYFSTPHSPNPECKKDGDCPRCHYCTTRERVQSSIYHFPKVLEKSGRKRDGIGSMGRKNPSKSHSFKLPLLNDFESPT